MRGRIFSATFCASLIFGVMWLDSVAYGQSAVSGEVALLSSAQNSYERGDYGNAIASLLNFLKVYPRSFEANELMGLCLVAEKKLSEGKRFLSEAAQIRPNSSLAHANLAADLAELQQSRAAETEFKRAIAIDPRSAELNHNLGELYANEGKIQSAIPYLKKSQQLDPTYNNGYDLSLAEMQAGALDAAAGDLRTLLLQKPTAELHSLLGAVLEKKGDYLASANEMQQAALLDPSENNIFAWGAELLRHQTLKPAADVFGRGAKQFPESSSLLIGLGVAKYLLSQNQDAVNAFCAAIDLDPKNPSPYFFLSKVQGIPDAQQARVSERFERYVAQSPKDAKARFYYAMTLWDFNAGGPETKDLPKVKSLLEGAIALDPRNAEAHLQLGVVYSRQGQNQAAVPEFERCIELDQKITIAHYRLGQTLIRLGAMERGRKELEEWKVLKAQEEQEDAKRQKEILQFLYSKAN